ncbi:hypothetical protein CL684_01385 [Candidatus Campbellbacteria bacterium]|nr:hypothetical protein [Candidatus Campbellbacteria bacterium]|tara:strand:- start:62 stop:424 length:363 start_codon:yes stop_codon:yes gene_type:complete
MEKAYIFNIEGILYILRENGRLQLTRLLFGFKRETREIQEKLLIEMFQETLEEEKDKFDLIKVIGNEEKKGLSSAIEKYIIYLKENFSNDEFKYWEKDLIELNHESFDFYNKNIWKKLNY